MNLIPKVLRRPADPEPVSADFHYRAAEPTGLERVDVRDPEALAAWSARLGAAPEQLTRAVIVVGHRLADIQHFLATESR